MNWTTTFSTGTIYYVLLSSHPAYQAAFTGGTSTGTSLSFTGLEADTEYFGFVSTTSGSGYILTGSTITLQVQGSTPVVTGELGAAPMSDVTDSALTVNWNTTYSTSTTYYVRLSTISAYQAAFTTQVTTGNWYRFTGLEANKEYFGYVSTMSGSGYILVGSTTTLQVQGSTPVVTGELGAAPMSDVTDSALTVNWTTTYSTGTTYYVRLSTISAYQAAFATQLTSSASYRFTGLEANKEYFGYVSTMSGSGYIQTGSTITLAASQPDCSVAWDTSAGGCKTNCSKSAIACGWDDQKSWSSGNTLSCAVEASKPANPPNGSYPATMNCNTNTWPLICDAGYTGGAATGNTGHCSATACHANVVIANCATVNQCTDQCTACQAGYQLSGGACALLSISSAAVSGVTENALTVNWATTYSPGTVYYVRLSSSGSAVSPVSSGTTTGISYEFHGLALNTGYSGYVSTSADSGYSQVGAAYTLAQKPAGAALSPVFYSSGTFSWDVNGNPAWTEYGYILSTELDFSNIVFTGTAAVSSAEMTGLSEGTTYYGRVRAINGDGVVTDYGSAVPVATLASVSTEPAGGLGIDIFSGITSNGLTMNWTASFPGGTVYYVRLTTSASGAVPASTGTTVGLSYAFSGLVPNTTYYGFVSTSPASGFLQVDANATLAEELSGAHLAPVYCSSVVFSWSTGANPAGTLYNYLVSPELDFSRDVISGTAAVNNANVT
ncbi:MAG TPA: hypothetical protein PKI19_13320, partial [Elusimicrobiales bacterium]|nr:hypothetical protein [Elusimicrobiales bacterium]